MKLYQKRNGNMSNQDWLDLGTLLLKLGYVVSIGMFNLQNTGSEREDDEW